MPDIYALINTQRKRLLAADDTYLASLVEGWQGVEDALQARIDALAQYMALQVANDQPISESALYQEQRYVALLGETRSVMMGYAQDVATSLAQQQQTMVQAGATDARAVVQEAGIRASFTALPTQATNVTIGLAGDGSPLRKLLEQAWPDGFQAMTNILIRNTALGVNPRKTAREMADATGASLSRMLTVARTEQLRAYRESSRATYQEHGVQRFKRLCSKSARTCYLCLAADGKEQDSSQPLAIHPNCRCCLLPVISGYTLSSHQAGAEWLASRSADEQRAILGKERHNLYKEGMALDGMYQIVNDPTWGPTLKAVAVAELSS